MVERQDRLASPIQATPPILSGIGHLEFTAAICSIGVYDYGDHKEARLPEHIFHSDFLESLKGKPLTMGHDGKTIGTIENVSHDDGIHVYASIVITDLDAINKVRNGDLSEFSVGYTCKLVDDVGTYLGMPYDRIQTKLKASHVALVDKARGGDTLSIKQDSLPMPSNFIKRQGRHYINSRGHYVYAIG